MSEVKVDTISERTAAGGVTIDGVLVKDGVATFQTPAGSPLVFEGATANAFETTFAITDPTADRTITFPDADVTIGAAGADTSLSNLVSAGADKIIKGWVCFGGAAAAIKDSFNVSSITDNGVGSYAVVWDTDFSNANYAVVCGGDASSGGGDYIQCQNTGQVVGSNDVHCYTGGAGSKFDPGYVSIVAIGDQ